MYESQQTIHLVLYVFGVGGPIDCGMVVCVRGGGACYRSMDSR